MKKKIGCLMLFSFLLTRSSEMLGNWDLTSMKRLQQKSNTSPGVQGGRFCFLNNNNLSPSDPFWYSSGSSNLYL